MDVDFLINELPFEIDIEQNLEGHIIVKSKHFITSGRYRINDYIYNLSKYKETYKYFYYALKPT